MIRSIFLFNRNSQNIIDLALQSQALAVMGGQFSQLGFVNNNNSSNNSAVLNHQQQYIGALGSPTALFGNLNAKSSSGIRGHRNNPLLGSSFPTSSSAKRTRLEASAPAKNGPGLLSGSRSTNLVPLVTSKHEHGPKPLPLKKTTDNCVLIRSIEEKVNGKIELENVNDILICGQCRHLFESVDVLMAHKMAECRNKNPCRCEIGRIF